MCACAQPELVPCSLLTVCHQPIHVFAGDILLGKLVIIIIIICSGSCFRIVKISSHTSNSSSIISGRSMIIIIIIIIRSSSIITSSSNSSSVIITRGLVAHLRIWSYAGDRQSVGDKILSR